MVIPGKLFVISAPSGAGKTTVACAAIEQLRPQCSLERVITYTTKLPRPEEIPGRDYHFISVAEFEAKIKEGFFLEYSGAYDHYYGTPKSILAEVAAGKSLILIIDRAGARVVRQMYTEAVLIWIDVPGVEILRQRLEHRGGISAEQIERRLRLARQEIEQEQKNVQYKHHIFNDFFDKAVKNLANLIKNELGLAR